jgi:DNA-directed RNA polymerase specialized sigma24 family protein
MGLAQAGDQVAYASLLVLLTSVTRQFVRRHLGASVLWVDDVVQETLISVHGARQTADNGRRDGTMTAAHGDVSCSSSCQT